MNNTLTQPPTTIAKVAPKLKTAGADKQNQSKYKETDRSEKETQAADVNTRALEVDTRDPEVLATAEEHSAPTAIVVGITGVATSTAEIANKLVRTITNDQRKKWKRTTI